MLRSWLSVLLIIFVSGCAATDVTSVASSETDDSFGVEIESSSQGIPDLFSIDKDTDYAALLDWDIVSLDDDPIVAFQVYAKKIEDDTYSLIGITDSTVREFVSTANFFDQGFGDYEFQINAIVDSGLSYLSTTENYTFTGFKNYKETWSSFSAQNDHPSEFFAPEGIDVDDTLTAFTTVNVYVADTQYHRILRFNALDGTLLDTYPNTFTEDGSSEEGYFFRPKDVAVDSTGFVWVADTGNDRLYGFSPSNSTDFASYTDDL